MSDKPLVSIIMPAYNAEKTIAESIQSVIEQTYKNWELIVINDGSIDNTSSIVYSFKDCRIILVEQANGGVANARNNGLRCAKGDFVAFLDSDDLWLSSKLTIQMACMIERASFFSYGKSTCFYLDKQNTHACFYDLDINLDYSQKILVFDFIPTLTVVMSRCVVDKIGFFDESLHGTEDWDYWIRVLQTYKPLFVDSVLALYRIQSNSLSHQSSKHYVEMRKVVEKNKKLYEKKSLGLMKWFFVKKEFLISREQNKIFNSLNLFFVILARPALLIRFLYVRLFKRWK